jgi:hypothetical protein
LPLYTSTHHATGGPLAFFVGGSELAMSSKSFRSKPDATFQLTGGSHCAYTRENSFILRRFASVVWLITPMLRTHSCASLRRSPHPQAQQSSGFQPTLNLSQGHSSSFEPEPHKLLPDIGPMGSGEMSRRVQALASALVRMRPRRASVFDRPTVLQGNSRSVGSQGIQQKQSRGNTDRAARIGAWPCER